MESQRLTFCSSHYDLIELDDWFNITATFRNDSTIYVDYKEFRNWNDIELSQEYVSSYENLLKNKTILKQMNHESSSEELSDDRDDVKNKNNIEQTKEELRRKSTYVDNFQKMKLAIHSELTS